MRIKILFLLILWSTSLTGQIQISLDTINLPASYGLSYEAPKIIFEGTILVNQVDSIYLVNQLRYDYFLSIESLLDELNSINSRVVDRYEKLILDNNELIFFLEKNFEKSKMSHEVIMSEIESSLSLTQNTLRLTQESLIIANESLDTAIDSAKKSRGNSIVEKILIGFGGVGVGMLLGLLVS